MTATANEPTAVVGEEDYALTRVPENARHSWINVAFQRFGQLSALAQFMLAASIGYQMTFWNAMLAIALGSILLEIVTIFVGIAGMREGLSTSVLARWTGFGRFGAGILGLAMATSLLGWFAFQNEIFAQGLARFIPLDTWVLALIGGIAVTLIVVYGFKFMGWIAYITVPMFLALAVWAISVELGRNSIGDLMTSAPPGEEISLAQGATIVAGGFIVGAIMTPDMTRFNRSVGDVVKQTVVGVTLGEFFVGVIAVLLAHGVKATAKIDNVGGLVVDIIVGSTGVVGITILVVSILKINDWNLYPASLGLTNAFETFFGLRVSRVWIAVALGLIGSVISAMGVSMFFLDFLLELGVLFPPIAGIMIVDYFILKTWRKELAESKARGGLPRYCPDFAPAGLIAWFAGYAVGSSHLFGDYFAFGIPSVNAIVVTMAVYWVLGAMGLARLSGPRSDMINDLDMEEKADSADVVDVRDAVRKTD